MEGRRGRDKKEKRGGRGKEGKGEGGKGRGGREREGTLGVPPYFEILATPLVSSYQVYQLSYNLRSQKVAGDRLIK